MEFVPPNDPDDNEFPSGVLQECRVMHLPNNCTIIPATVPAEVPAYSVKEKFTLPVQKTMRLNFFHLQCKIKLTFHGIKNTLSNILERDMQDLAKVGWGGFILEGEGGGGGVGV